MDEPTVATQAIATGHPRFSQDFYADFDVAMAGLSPSYSGQPYAFVRYGDGEAAIMRQIAHRAKSDGWRWDGQEHPLRQRLIDSLACRLPGYCIGVSAYNHHPYAHEWYLEQLVDLPPERLTLASLFIFANYERFQDVTTNLANFCVVSG